MKKMQSLTVNGNSYQISDPEAVSFAAPQDLSPEQKQQAKENLGLGGQYELIEDITLTEDVTSISRSKDPNGVTYNFSAVRILAEVPACSSALGYNQMIIILSSRATYAMIYHQANYAVATTAKKTFAIARNDNGMLECYIGVADGSNVTNITARPYFAAQMWENVSSLSLSMNPSNAIIPAGTRVQIYGIRR